MTQSNLDPQVDSRPVQKELVLTRVFDAPTAVVFRMWTDPRHLAAWWGPHGFSNPVCEVDARPGGAILVHMQWPDGKTVNPMRGVFHEVVEPERLVFTTTTMEDDAGNPRLEVLNTVTFENDNGKTRLTLRAAVMVAAPEAAPALAGMEQGWTESLERLGVHAVSAHRRGEV